MNTGQIQMVTPQKVLQPAGMVQQSPRFQTPVQNVRTVNPTLRAARPRAGANVRIRGQVNVRPVLNAGQQMINTSTPIINQRPRPNITFNRTPNQVNQIQPIISVGTPKTVVSITSPPRGPIVRTPTQVYQKQNSAAQQTHQVQASPSTSNSSIATEDLEDSIQAARITKQATNTYTIVQPTAIQQQQINEANDNQIVTLQSRTQMSVAEYKQRQAQQAHAQAQVQAQTQKQLSGIKPMQRAVIQNRRPRFASPNTVRVQRPVMVSSLKSPSIDRKIID